ELNQSLMFPSSIFATAFHKFPYVRKSAAELPTILTYRDAFGKKNQKILYFSGQLRYELHLNAPQNWRNQDNV
ncbi:MAG TPA: hypothetical protein VNY07_01380, partial [Chthoniobacterales bacterium]|nr:hypothetical protein [Chthoniobacterales bacterium]